MGYSETSVSGCRARNDEVQTEAKCRWQGRDRRSLEEAPGGEAGGGCEGEGYRLKEGCCLNAIRLKKGQ
jgi:hypothetical protein